LSTGTLFIVATPIGNLDDISPRARAVLTSVDLIAAEDTRVTGRLLSHFGIKSRQIALHDHNEAQRAASLIAELQKGHSIALVSDAGTPLISDPGFRLTKAAHDAGITVSPVPGASAVVCALSASGLPTDRFAYEGFLPAKGVARQKRLSELETECRTMVFYESVHRISDTVVDAREILGGDRQAFIGRELTKLYEQCVAGDLASLAAMLDDGSIVKKGEFVLLIAGCERSSDDGQSVAADLILATLLEELPGKQAAAITAKLTGENKNSVYRRMLELKS